MKVEKQGIMVTGAAGFIGSHLVRSLIKHGHTVYGVDNLTGGFMDNLPKGEWAKNNFYLGDCADVAGNNAARFWQGVDTLVHCAANAREGASQFQPRSVTHNNVMAYTSILTSAIAHGVKNVVLFSSMSVYGDQQTPFTEEMPRKPVDVYGCNKAMMEHVTEILSSVHGFSYAIIRPHNVFGEYQCLSDKFRNVVAIFMNRMMRGEPLYIYGDGNQRRAFSCIEDSLPCFVEVIERCPIYHTHAFNIGGTKDITVNELAEACVAAMGEREDYPREYLPSRPLEVHTAFSSYAKSQEYLGYTEWVGWRQGVRNMAVWAKGRGATDWRNNEPLEIVNSKTPVTWLN